MINTLIQRTGVLGCFIVLAVIPASKSVAADRNLRVEIRVVAEEIAQHLGNLQEKSVSLGQFSGLPQLGVTGGPGIAFTLKSELEAAGVEVKVRAKYGIHGRFRVVRDAQSQTPAMEITADVVDLQGKVIAKIRRGVFGEGNLIATTGPTAELPPEAPPQQRVQTIVERLEKPAASLQGAMVRSAADSPYGVEILVRTSADEDYQVLDPKLLENLAFVGIERKCSYAVRLSNDSPHDAAVALFIDGLSMFTFSEHTEYGHVVIPAGGNALIEGWHRNNEESNQFEVVEYANSPAARILQNTSTIGTITASFAAAWSGDKDRPDDEPRQEDTARSANGTGLGKKISKQYDEVTRCSGVVRSVVSVRYSR